MTKEEAALKAIAQASQKMVDDFIASNEGQQWVCDGFAGLGVVRFTEDGRIHRVAPTDFRPPTAETARRPCLNRPKSPPQAHGTSPLE